MIDVKTGQPFLGDSTVVFQAAGCRAFTQGQDVVIHDIQVNELVEKAFARMGTVRPPKLGDITLQGKRSGE